jgi:hypothetical protein
MVLHEAGHAYDFLVGGSSSARFLASYNAENKTSWRGYYLQATNPRYYLLGAYAESFANFYGGNVSQQPQMHNYWGYR